MNACLSYPLGNQLDIRSRHPIITHVRVGSRSKCASGLHRINRTLWLIIYINFVFILLYYLLYLLYYRIRSSLTFYLSVCLSNALPCSARPSSSHTASRERRWVTELILPFQFECANESFSNRSAWRKTKFISAIPTSFFQFRHPALDWPLMVTSSTSVTPNTSIVESTTELCIVSRLVRLVIADFLMLKRKWFIFKNSQSSMY